MSPVVGEMLTSAPSCPGSMPITIEQSEQQLLQTVSWDCNNSAGGQLANRFFGPPVLVRAFVKLANFRLGVDGDGCEAVEGEGFCGSCCFMGGGHDRGSVLRGRRLGVVVSELDQVVDEVLFFGLLFLVVNELDFVLVPRDGVGQGNVSVWSFRKSVMRHTIHDEDGWMNTAGRDCNENAVLLVSDNGEFWFHRLEL
jgi:hypothetical protein